MQALVFCLTRNKRRNKRIYSALHHCLSASAEQWWRVSECMRRHSCEQRQPPLPLYHFLIYVQPRETG